MGRATGKGAVNSNEYDQETIEKALTAVALSAGNCRQAHDLLADEGYAISQQTLTTWSRRRYVDRYIEAVKRVQSHLNGKMAAWAVESVQRGHELKMRMYDQLETALGRGDIPAKDLSSNIRNIAVEQGISITKQGELTGRPIVHEHRSSPEELLEGLKRLNPALVVDSDAEEVRDVEALPEKAA